MADVQNPGYLSIGEVLGLLLEEFPEITISKIRFLESQGLISPERTASGYRKFFEDDVELLRVILTEQRENYLPLRVIKDRLDSGEIDPTGDPARPNGLEHDVSGSDAEATPDDPPQHRRRGDVPSSSIASHPAARHAAPPAPRPASPGGGPSDPTAAETGVAAANGTAHGGAAHGGAAHDGTARAGGDAAGGDAAGGGERVDAGATAEAGRLLTGVLLDRGELCAMVGMTERELSELESFGVVTARGSGGGMLYGDDAVSIARTACEFLRLGVDARHLRSWRTSAEREASLYEQLITPRLRQRNPESRAQALQQLETLETLGGRLRSAMMRQALRHHRET